MDSGPIATYLIGVILPYIAVGVLLGGLAYRLYRWLSPRPTSISLGAYPMERSRGRRALKIGRELLTFPRILRNAKGFWLMTWPFHLSLALLLVGHTRMLFEWTPLWQLLNFSEGEIEFAALLAGGTAGILFIYGVVALLLQRLASPVRQISDPQDFGLLLLLLAIGFTGNYMRFVVGIDLLALREYMRSLLAFRPHLPPLSPAFLLHYLLVQGLMLYFPFSRLMHIIGSILALQYTVEVRG